MAKDIAQDTARTRVLPDVDALRHDWREDDVRALVEMQFNDLIFEAQARVRYWFPANAVQKSMLLSIKTGGCPEDCAYCSQSAHFKTGVAASKLISCKEVEEAARAAKASGASRYCMGAAWRAPKDRDMDALCEMVRAVKALDMETCMTLGMLTREQAVRLKEAGLDYYNHNIDTSPAYYEKIITTRTFNDRLETLEHVRKSGMKVCCGGIIGMGETRADRLEMLRTLANLPEHPESVPINMLIRIPGTPLGEVAGIEPLEFVRTIALARIMMPRSVVRLSAGREHMSTETQALCFLAGANSIFIGARLLTAKNPEPAEDETLFDTLGLEDLPAAKERDTINNKEART